MMRLTCYTSVHSLADKEQAEVADEVLRKVQLCCNSLHKKKQITTEIFNKEFFISLRGLWSLPVCFYVFSGLPEAKEG